MNNDMDETIPPVLGILGGGQLARMLALAAWPLGVDVKVMQAPGRSPQEVLPWEGVNGDWNEGKALAAFAGWSGAGVVTLENEFVDAGALRSLEEAGWVVRPGAETMSVVQDKLHQKEALLAAGLSVPEFVPAGDPEAVRRAGERFGWPVVLKARRDGYDGKGNARVDGPEGVEAAWARLEGDRRPLMVEGFCRFERELAVMIVRGAGGEMRSYPVVETVQADHICHVVRAPAGVSPAVAAAAEAMARSAVEAVGMVGAMGVEMFVRPDGEVLINELAPRVHNSGHYTIEGCVCSQFENHVRAVLGWPLGETELVRPAAVMVNVLGRGAGPGEPMGRDRALAVPGVHVHVYGKGESRGGRKMGHVTALGETVEEAEARARRAAEELVFGKRSEQR